MRPTVKIFGLTRLDDVRMCIRHGADILGFVTEYPRTVPWNLTAECTTKLISNVSRQVETCIVTGGTPEKLLWLISETKPDYVQLHCGESLSDTIFIIDKLRKSGVRIIKTLFPNTLDLEKTAADFCDAGVYALLYDPRTPDNAISGGAADITAFIKLRSSVSCPVILAGGINPGNVADIVQRTDAQIIDLMTGVESCPGIKDEVKVIKLFQALRS